MQQSIIHKTKVFITKPSTNLNEGIIIRVKGLNNIYKLKQKLSEPNKQQVLRTQMNLPKSDKAGK